MSRFFPHAQFAEDQSFAKTTLTTHVLYRGFQSGAVVGIGSGSVAHIIQELRSRRSFSNRLSEDAGAAGRSSTHLPKPSVSSAVPMRPSIGCRVLAGAGTGAVIGTFLMIPGLMVRMWGREDIEWKDRSWRLLENRGQLEVDDWSAAGTVVGALTASATKTVQRVAPWKKLTGGAAMGSIGGIAGYMMYRYGLHKGER